MSRTVKLAERDDSHHFYWVTAFAGEAKEELREPAASLGSPYSASKSIGANRSIA